MNIPNILLPGDDAGWTDDYTSIKVIASQWGNDHDEDKPLWFVALLLHPTAPYYEVVDFTWTKPPRTPWTWGHGDRPPATESSATSTTP